jgi:hypothetical protein
MRSGIIIVLPISNEDVASAGLNSKYGVIFRSHRLRRRQRVNKRTDGHGHNGRVRWGHQKGDVYGFLRAINSPSEDSWLTRLVSEMSSSKLEDHLTELGEAYFSTQEGKIELYILLNLLHHYDDKKKFIDLPEQQMEEKK